MESHMPYIQPAASQFHILEMNPKGEDIVKNHQIWDGFVRNHPICEESPNLGGIT